MTSMTPMVQQYLKVKERHQDAILFYRLGDFYEMFFDDAKKVSQLLNLTLTTRNKNQEDSVPLCGVPHHSAQGYINRLVALGHKVAICEQMEDPRKAKGIIKREVVQVVTPGLRLDPEGLEGKSHNYLAAVYSCNNRFGLAVTDISTGYFGLTELFTDSTFDAEISRLEPKEILLLKSQKKLSFAERLFSLYPSVRFSDVNDSFFDRESAEDLYRSTYQNPLDDGGAGNHSLQSYPQALFAGGMILHYLNETKILCGRLLDAPLFYNTSETMILDCNAKKNLELVRTAVDESNHGSLLWLLDHTKTSMGSRLLKGWLQAPLMDPVRINQRLEAVSEIKDNSVLLEELKKHLASMGDMERIENRIVRNKANACDLISLANSLREVGEIRERIKNQASSLLKDVSLGCDPVSDLQSLIIRTLVPEPPVVLNEGGMIQEGVNAELDELRSIEKNAKYHISAMEVKEREATGISSLKIRFSQVFGYAIEITHVHRSKIPPHYIRKQTLSQAERYITPELKEYEEKVLCAEEKILSLEHEIFMQLREEASQLSERIKKTAGHIALLDVLISLASVAKDYGYVRPEITEEPLLDIRKGRHPLVEVLFGQEPFVPNDVFLDTDKVRLMLITGPNMAGKSTVMRQTALITLLAQMGSFVPAESARIGIVDRIFTRIGASDRLQKGESTFMVEMLETAQILAQATKRSLILLDEIGRGTSTFDGLSIAWAVCETLHDRIGARTLFATHYHELTDLSSEKEGIKNFHMLVKEWNGKILFLRELVSGATNRSYGVHVAGMAGLPEETILRARKILEILEEKDLQFKEATQTNPKAQLTLFAPKTDPLLDELRKIDVNTLTPLDALNFLSRIQKGLSP